MNEDFFMDSVSPTGMHQCNVETDNCSVWMYLLDLTTREVISDCPIGSLVQPISFAEFKDTYKRGDTPPLVREYSTDRAVVPELRGLELRWGDDDSVAAILDDEPIAMIVAGDRKGFSKATSKEGPWGKPWDEKTYTEKFPERKRVKKK